MKAIFIFATLLILAVGVYANNATLTIDQIRMQWQNFYRSSEFSKIVFREIDLLNDSNATYSFVTERYQNGSKIKVINNGRSFDPCNIRIVYYLPTKETLHYTPALRQAHIYPHHSGSDPELTLFNDAVLATRFYTSTDVNGTPLMIRLCNDPCAVVSSELQIVKVADVNVSCNVLSAVHELDTLVGGWHLWITQDKGMMPIKYVCEYYSKKTGRLVSSRIFTVEKISRGNDIWYPGIVFLTVVTNEKLFEKRKIEILDLQCGVTYDSSFFEPNLPDDTTVIDDVKGCTYIHHKTKLPSLSSVKHK